MNPPHVASSQLALRLLLELAALIALGMWGRSLQAGWEGWLFAVLLPLAAAVAWVTFAVRGDPSRSGNAPIPVPGTLRLLLELLIFLGGAGSLAATGHFIAAAVMAGLVAVHHALTVPRIRWLLSQ